MDLEQTNHPQNKPVLRFGEAEVRACRILTHDEAREYLARVAFASDLPVFDANTVHADPERIRVKHGFLDARPEIAVALRERDKAIKLTAQYGASILFERGEANL